MSKVKIARRGGSSLRPHKNQRRAGGDVHLNVLVPTGPRRRCRKELAIKLDTVMATEPGFVRVEQDAVLAWLGHGDAVVGEGLGRVEVENEYGAGPVKGQDFVALVLQG